jgi:dsRNA-specific ribonuclease
MSSQIDVLNGLMSGYLKRQNAQNKWITKQAVESIMSDNGFELRVNNIEIYQQAFIHKSYLQTASYETPEAGVIPLQPTCNESYEFLGDTLLNSVVGTYLYQRYPYENEGFLTKTRTKMVRGTTLGVISKKLGFGEWLIISQHVENEGGRTNTRILEDVFEAFLAAIFLDNGSQMLPLDWSSNQKECADLLEQINCDSHGSHRGMNATDSNCEYDPEVIDKLLKFTRMFAARNESNGYLCCQRFIQNAFEKHVDLVKLIQFDDNYKDQLQTQFQKLYNIFPKWETLSNGEGGKANQKLHTVCVRDRCGFVIGVGKDRKKTDAEQMASRAALVYMGIINKDHGEDFFR